MLPFTKRPGRTDEDRDVATSNSEGGNSAPVRSLLPSMSDEELTTLAPRSVVSASLPLSRPLPAAGRPPSVPAPARSRPAPLSARPPAPSSRRMVEQEDDDGRTIVRGAPKIVKRAKPSQPPPSLAPRSVTPRSHRAGLLAPPPALIERIDDAGSTLASRGSEPPPAQELMTVFEGAPSRGRAVHAPPASFAPPPASYSPPAYHHPPPSFASPASYPPPPSSHARAPYSVAPPSYAPLSDASMSVPGVAVPASLPAHFMRNASDPPATSITSNHRIASGRPALSWMFAVLVCGLLVGVFGVAMLQGSDSFSDATAAFIDPSRAAKAPAAQPPAPTPPAPAPETTPAPTTTAPAIAINTPPPAAPAVTVAPVVAAPVVAAAAAPAKPAAPPVAAAEPAPRPTSNVAFAPVTVAPKAAPARPAVAWKPPPAPAPKPAAVAKAAPPASSDDDAPKKATKRGAKGEDDDTKKALEALHKAQLESASSFGEK